MTKISVIEASKFVTILNNNNDLNILDIRTNIEFQHLSLNYQVTHKPLHTIDVAEFPKSEKETYILCKAGPRAFKIAECLENQGHENLVVIDGGMMGCKSCDAPVKISDTPPAPEKIMRAVQESFQKFIKDNG